MTGTTPSLHPLRLGFLAFTSYHEPGASQRSAFDDSLELFRHAEQLNLDGGWLRVRHFERGLTGIFPYLGALSQATERLRIGTAVVPIAHENYIRLAEDAATSDILSNGRIELGVSTGIATSGPIAEALAKAYHHEDGVSVSDRSSRTLQHFLHAITGDELFPTSEELSFQFTDPGEGLRVYPVSPRLGERIWYGSGTLSSALRAAKLGLNLQVSTINTEPADSELRSLTDPQLQAYLFQQYRENLDTSRLEQSIASPRPRELSISRYVIPYSNAAEKERFISASDKHVARWPELNGQGWKVGTVEEVIEQLLEDEAIIEARKHFETTLLLNLPSQLGAEWTRHLLDLTVNEVAPQIGWEAREALTGSHSADHWARATSSD